MDIFEIDGPVQLSGSIDVAGSKNAALPIMAAALLAGGTTVIPNAPDLAVRLSSPSAAHPGPCAPGDGRENKS